MPRTLRTFGNVLPCSCSQLQAGRAAPTALPLDQPQEFRTPRKDKLVSEKVSPIHGVVLGATERSYLMRDNQVGAAGGAV